MLFLSEGMEYRGVKFLVAILAVFSFSVGMACSEPASPTTTTPDVIPSELPEPAPTTLVNPTATATPTPEPTPILHNAPSTTPSLEGTQIPTSVPTRP